LKSATCERLVRNYILPSLSSFHVKGKLLFAEPVRHLLRGYYFEDSAFDATRFAVCVFVQPLYVPSSVLVFNFGSRLGSIVGKAEIWWNLSAESEKSIMADVLSRICYEAEPRFGSIADPEARRRYELSLRSMP
jgi:hypothetical protein